MMNVMQNTLDCLEYTIKYQNINSSRKPYTFESVGNNATYILFPITLVDYGNDLKTRVASPCISI